MDSAWPLSRPGFLVDLFRSLFTRIHVMPTINLPGTTTKFRCFERVATVDPQYNIYDVGFEYAEGGIDSLVVPGSGSYATLKAAYHNHCCSEVKPVDELDIKPDTDSATDNESTLDSNN